MAATRTNQTVQVNEPKRVGVMVQSHRPYTHHQSVNQGIMRYGREHGWCITQAPFADEQLKQDPAAFDGVIGRVGQRLLSICKKTKTPVVNVWYSSPVSEKVVCVFPDYAGVGQMCAEHLMSRGIEHFGYIRYHGDRTGLHASQAFEKALAEYDYAVDSICISRSLYDQYDAWLSAHQELEQWFARWKTPIGVVCSHDEIARYLATLCGDRGLKVPYDVALLGHGDHPMYCLQPQPTLSSVDMNYHEVGYQAATVLDDLMGGGKLTEQVIEVPPKRMIARQSTDVMAVSDSLLAAALRYIAEQCDQPIRVGDVAAAMDVTRRTLERRFQAKLQRTIADQITHMRMERFKRLLFESTEPLKTLAEKCGFSSLNHLYTVFSRHEGCSPSDYRKKQA